MLMKFRKQNLHDQENMLPVDYALSATHVSMDNAATFFVKLVV